MTSQPARTEPPTRGEIPPAPALFVTADRHGRIATATGRWPGSGIPRAAQVDELVHERNHDLLAQVAQWAWSSGSVERGVGVQVRSNDGWDEAVVTAMSLGDKLRWTFVPVLPDPTRSTLAAVNTGRDVSTVLDMALSAFVDSSPAIWATVHYGRDRAERYRDVVASIGQDTFRRAVEAAVSGDVECPWDQDLHEDRHGLPLSDFGDGIKLAGPHAGLGACTLIGVPSATSGRDAGCLAIWSETAGQLESPEASLLINRVLSAATLAFQAETGRDSQRKLATRDGLTGLWNRPAFFAHLKATVTDRDCAVLCVDIDDFRAINEWHGYGAGDDVLIEVGRRLRSVMRPGDIIARMSADEFALLCMDVSGEDAAVAIAERVLEASSDPYQLAGEAADVGLSLGIAVATSERNGAQLLQAAERAMAEAKDDARGRWCAA